MKSLNTVLEFWRLKVPVAMKNILGYWLLGMLALGAFILAVILVKWLVIAFGGLFVAFLGFSALIGFFIYFLKEVF